MKKPHVTIKVAQTLDGKIAAMDGSSKWITSRASRKFAHKLRADNDAVLVGINTVLRDNPRLTTRLVKGKNPIRVVVDTKLRTPLTASVAKVTRNAKTIIITTKKAPREKIARLKRKNVEIIVLPIYGNIDMIEIIRILYKKGVKKILVEGGGKIITSFLKAGLADKIIVIVAPKLLGRGIEAIGDLNIGNIKAAFRLRLKNVKRVGKDICLIFIPKRGLAS